MSKSNLICGAKNILDIPMSLMLHNYFFLTVKDQYYSIKGRPDIVYSSQTGDGHICIPMCIGLFALFHTIQIPSFFSLGVIMIMGAGLVHFVFITFLGRLPRLMGLALTGTYYLFLYKGLIKP